VVYRFVSPGNQTSFINLPVAGLVLIFLPARVIIFQDGPVKYLHPSKKVKRTNWLNKTNQDIKIFLPDFPEK
jgi:hypothetical protein